MNTVIYRYYFNSVASMLFVLSLNKLGKQKFDRSQSSLFVTERDEREVRTNSVEVDN